MKSLPLIALTVALVAGCASRRNAGVPAEFVDHAMRSTVTVLAFDPDKAMPSVGSGFFLAPDQVASARHMLAGADRAEIRTSSGQTIPVDGIIAQDQTMDLVIMQLAQPAADARTLRVADLPPVGQRIIAVGSPLGLEWSVSEGIISATRDVPNAGMVLQHTVAVSVGSSGGPLLNLRGEVVGIQTGCITTDPAHVIQAGQSLNFAVPACLFRSLKTQSLQPLLEAKKEVAAGWVAPVTRDTDLVALRPLTRDDFPGSLVYFQQRAKEQPEEPDVWFRLGICQERSGNLKDAAEAYGKALACRQDLPIAWNNLGSVRIKQNKYSEAVDAFQHAIKLKSDYVEAHNSLAVACYELKRYPEAVDAAEEAVRLNPGHSAANHNLGRAYLKSGRRDKALDQYNRLLKLDRVAAEELKSQIDREQAKANERAGQD